MDVVEGGEGLCLIEVLLFEALLAGFADGEELVVVGLLL